LATSTVKKNVAIVGGGLAGLISGIELSAKGVPCILFERKKYPLQRVCGEYISNEALPFLKSRGLYPDNIIPTRIDSLLLSSVRGQSATIPLDLGGFGVSRYFFDHFLAERARQAGVVIHEGIEVTDITFDEEKFVLQTGAGEVESHVVIAAHGKRSKLDNTLQRDFARRRSPYVGVKYHIKSHHPNDLISLHNFPGGYCGVVNVEANITNLCYLVRRERVQEHKNIPTLEDRVLSSNPLLKPYIDLIDRTGDPVVINEISFATKTPVERHILMAGDAAGMITPLCGNGMAMAIHSGKLISEIVVEFCAGRIGRHEMEARYRGAWSAQFRHRLQFGRAVQKLFGSPAVSTFSVQLLSKVQSLAKLIVKNTHGPVFY
jgi:flavin-dependent dehydrogenase